MTAWRWVPANVVYAIHSSQLAAHGGLQGIRDHTMVDSAVARPVNLASYGTPDAPALATAYAFGLAKNHGFIDGNKRTAWVVARLLLADNGYRLNFDKLDAIRTMEGLDTGKLSESDLAAWFRHHCLP